jgi:hypothetical protein
VRMLPGEMVAVDPRLETETDSACPSHPDSVEYPKGFHWRQNLIKDCHERSRSVHMRASGFVDCSSLVVDKAPAERSPVHRSLATTTGRSDTLTMNAFPVEMAEYAMPQLKSGLAKDWWSYSL